MVVLADELLESFFDSDFSASFHLEPVVEAPLAHSNSGLLGGLLSSIVSDNNIKIFHKLTDEFGKTIGQHQVTHRPSIGRVDRRMALQEPKARESLLPPSIRENSPSRSSSPSLAQQTNITSTSTHLQVAPTPPPKQKLEPPSPLTPKEMAPMLAAQNTVLERTPFAIDDPHDEYSDDDESIAVDDTMLDEVDAFLEENDSGLSEADRALQKDLLTATPMK